MLSINAAVRDTPISAEVPVSPAVDALVTAVDSLEELLEQTPPAQHAMRYGNPAYRCPHCLWCRAQPLQGPDMCMRQDMVQLNGLPGAQHAQRGGAARPARRAPRAGEVSITPVHESC